MALIRTRPRAELVEGLIRACLNGRTYGMSDEVVDVLTEASLLLDGGGIPYDEVPPDIEEIDTPSARTTDPGTSKGFKTLTAAGSRGKIAVVFYEAGVVAYTAREATQLAGLAHQRSPWKRVSELAEVGIIKATGKTLKDPTTGREQQLYRITQIGEDKVREMLGKGKVAV